jgi:hypothetical protein
MICWEDKSESNEERMKILVNKPLHFIANNYLSDISGSDGG